VSSARERLFWFWSGWAAALPALFAPIGDPDVWWHLSAARRWVRDGLFSRADWLSFTFEGQPWMNFEWLSGTLFYFVYVAGGLGGLWLLKTVLMAGIGAVVFLSLKRLTQSFKISAIGLSAWAAAMMARGDVRTELFSFLFFSLGLYVLETTSKKKIPAFAVLLSSVLFAVWANLHAGFLYGLVLLGVYGLLDPLRGRRAGWRMCLAAGALGALLNPFGVGVYQVLWEHAMDAGALASVIKEWGPLSWGRASHWPAWFLMLGVGVLVVRRRRVPVHVGVLLFIFALAAIRHARLSSYWVICAVVYGGVFAAEDSACRAFLKRKRAAAGIIVFFALFSAWCGGRGLLGGVFDDAYTPVRAEAFIEENPVLGGTHFYSDWGWGGYLGYRWDGQRKVFQDGRYLFHPLLLQAASTVSGGPRAWQKWLEGHGIDAALLQNNDVMLNMTRVCPSGERKEIPRPYYVQYMPKEQWALVYWDEQALLFVRRSVLSRSGLDGLEYRYYLPRDHAAREDALSRQEIPLLALKREGLRQREARRRLPRVPDFR
jgi:hypothetical protein